ncbi:uncharacterized protein PAE49_011838 isoform 2-T2 [Odontesthes bonariensis]|uniref:uncharacterized protein LOC142389797 isoform X2 n=1 Tax=Odontesthes bonariensis TaxID=219752 RepID=UPI003F58BAAA
MDVSMDPMENSNAINDDNDSVEQQSQSEEAESGVRPTLSQVRKSWGFRRTTIAKREFMEEVGDLTRSPPLVRRGRSRRTNQTPETSTETRTTQKAAQTARSVLDDLEWSAPSSPVSEDSKPASEASVGVSLDPSLWQDFGSAFHTAFSLLGGEEDMPMTMSDSLAVPDISEATNAVEPSIPEAVEVAEMPHNMDDMEIAQPVVPDVVAGGEIHDMVLISSQEDDSDEMTLLQIKEQLASSGRQGNSRARGGKGGRGKSRGRGRGRGRGKGKGKGRGRGRGRAVELQGVIADDEDSNDDVILVSATEQQHLQEEEKENAPHSPPGLEVSPAHFDVTLSPPQQLSSDCIILDGDLSQTTAVTHGQYDDAPEEMEEEEGKKENEVMEAHPSVSDTERCDSNALHCICRQKQDKRFMICCGSCQVWFHGDCVGVSETQGRKMERKGHRYTCPPCTTQKQSQLEFESHPLADPALSFPECLTLSPPCDEGVRQEEQQALKETVVVVEEEQEGQALVTRTEAEPEAEAEHQAEAEMETDSSLPLCTGPGCWKQALPDSVYCGTDCILQHAAVTMKTLSGPKVSKSKGRAQRKAATARPAAKAQRAGRVSKRLAAKALDDADEEEMMADDGEQEVAACSVACDPSLTEVQSTSIPSSNLNTTSDQASKTVEADSEAVSPSKRCPEDPSTDAPLPSQPPAEEAPPQSPPQEKAKEPESSSAPKEQRPSTPPTPAKSHMSAASQSPTTSAPRHHETGALIVTKTAYVIPKKQPVSNSPSSHESASVSCQKPSSAPALLNETRNLPVSPAPSAPSSRPSQPNNQVRQSIQRSLTSILFKRVCDCEDLEMSESEAAKLVASIEMEMFDIFRNTDSKYMNKYRTIMFNLKDPRNKGLLYRVVRGEIGPFRLARMSQKDMQATKVPEPGDKETQAKDAAAKGMNFQKPEAVKVDLPSLNPARPDRKPDNTKRSLPAPPLKTRASQPSRDSAVPDVLSCMLKDTTSEHKSHIFDLKCRICTGRTVPAEEDEPVKKKLKVTVSRDKQEPALKKSAGDDSPLLAPAVSPETDSPPSLQMEPSSSLNNDSPKLTIVESPASPADSPASPTLESPASPIMESPASPTSDTPTAAPPKRTYTPVVIPAVSTVTITRRDPRTAPSRITASSGRTSGPSHINHNQAVPYGPVKEPVNSRSAPPSSLPLPKTLPKSILMKPSSTADPRLYGASSRTMVPQSPVDGDTAHFLAKQDILWKGFLNMLTVAKFVTKGYLVSGSAENLKADLPDTIQIGGRILPETVWDYVEKLKTSLTKELCVIRFQPATEEEEVAYVSLFSYFSSRRRFGVVANISRSIKDVYLVPLSAKESVPPILQPLEGPGFEKNRPNLLLGLAIVQRTKRPGSLPQETEEKRPKVNMSKDPMWIPKPPVLYGSDKLEIFQPYDPETPASTSLPGSSSCPGSPSDSSSSGSVTVPSFLSSIRVTSCTSSVVATESTSNSNSAKNPKSASSKKTPLNTILKTLFGTKQSDTIASSDGSSTKTVVSLKKIPMFSQASGSMVDPIVQQYGQKSKVKQIEEEENDFDRPYDPEEEYDPAIRYKTVTPQTTEKRKTKDSTLPDFVDDDVAYDPEDETIFDVIQSGVAETKPPVSTQMLDGPSCPTPVSTPSTAQSSTPAASIPNLPTGTVVVSAATLSEQQRMLEELNKQIEEQKRQLKEQEEALRQQREAVGMFMAHFSVSDSLMSPPTKASPLSQLSSTQSGIMQTESKSSDKRDEANNFTETKGESSVDSKTVAKKLEGATADLNLKNDINTAAEQNEIEEHDKYSSAGEIEDSDVAYDPEDESLFDEIQEDVFKGGSTKTSEASSRTGHSASHKSVSPTSYQSRKRRSSPKRRSRRDRDHHRSPSGRSLQRSRSHSRKRRDRDRHRRSERDRSKHGTRDPSGHHRKDHTTHHHSRGRRRSPLSPRKKHSASLSPKRCRAPFPEISQKREPENIPCSLPDSVVGKFVECKTLPSPLTIKSDPDGPKLECNLYENSNTHSHKLYNVKTEISDPTKFQKLEKKTVSDHDNSGSDCFTQGNKPSVQERFFQDKCENTIPLREIDPPIRDSPESPDPEPQFMKPSSLENNDCAKTEESKNPEEHTSVPMASIKSENNCVPNGGQAAMSVTGVDLQIPSVKVQGLIKTDNHTEAENTVLKNQEIVISGGGHSNQPTGLHPDVSCPDIRDLKPDMTESGHRGGLVDLKETGIRFPGPEIKGLCMQGILPDIWGSGPGIKDEVIKVQGKHVMGPGACMQDSVLDIREPGIQHQNSNRNNLWPVRGTEISPMQDTQSSLQGVNHEVKGLYPDMRQNYVSGVSNSPMLESSIQNERGNLFMNSLLSHTLVPDNRISGLRDPLSMYQINTGTRGHGDERSQNSSCLQLENSDGKSDVMKKGISFGDPKLDVRVPHVEALRSNMRGEGETDSCQSSVGLRGDQPQSRHDGSSFQDTGLGKGGFWSHGEDADLSMMGCGQRIEDMPNFTNPDWKGPGTLQSSPNTDLCPSVRDPNWNIQSSDIGKDWKDMSGTDPLRGGPFTHGRGPNMERQVPGNSEYRQAESEIIIPNTQDTRHDGREPGRIDFNVTGPERRGPEMQLSRHDMRGLDFTDHGPERHVPEREVPVHDRRKPVHLDLKRHGHETRGPETQVPIHERRGPGGPAFMGQRSERRGPSTDNEGSSLRIQGGLESKGSGFDGRGITMEGLGHDRRRSVGPLFGGPGPERKSPAVESHRSDMKRFTSPDFRGPCPERRGPNMEGPGPDRRVPGDLEFKIPEYERESLSVQGPGPQSRGLGRPNSREPGPENGGPLMGGPKIERELLGSSDFDRPVHELTGPTLENQGPERRGSRRPDFWGPVSERRGPRAPNTGGHGPDREEPYVGVAGCNFIGQEPERTGPGIDGPGPHNRKGGPHSGNDEMEGGRPNMVYNRGHNRKGPDFCGPGSDFPGPVLNRRGRGGPRMGRPVSQHAYPNRESPGSDRRGPEGPNSRESGPKIITNMEGTEHSWSYPGGPVIRGHESRGTHLEMEGPQSDMRGANFKGVGPDRRNMVRKGPGGFRRPDNESRGPDIEGPSFHRQRPGGSSFREPGPERQCPDMESPGPDWGEESGGPDCRGPGIRQKGTNVEGLRHERKNYWGKSAPIQESLDLEAPGSHRTSRNFRALGPMRRNIRGPRPNVWDSAPSGSGTDPEEQWLDRRGNIEALGNEGDNWDRHGNWSSEPIQDDLDEHSQDRSRQGPRSEWRNSGSSGLGLTKNRQKMQYPGPQRGPGDDRDSHGCRDSEPLQQESEVICAGPSWGAQENEWREPDRGSAGPFFRDERNPDKRGYDRGRGRGRGRGWHQDFRGNMTGRNMDGSGAFRKGPDLINLSSDKREFDMESLDSRGQDGPELRHPGRGYINSNTEGLESYERDSDYGEQGSEWHGVDMEDPGLQRQGFEQDFRRKSRGSKMRHRGPTNANMRTSSPQSSDFGHGPGMWDTNTEFLESNRGGFDMREGEQGHMGQTNSDGRRGSHQVARFQDSCESHSMPFSRPVGPGPSRGGKSFPAFDGPQNQKVVRPPRHRGGLLPTPTEGLLSVPNHLIKNSEVYSMEGKQMGHPKNWDPSRGRAGHSRYRGRSRGRGGGSPAGDISTVEGEH